MSEQELCEWMGPDLKNFYGGVTKDLSSEFKFFRHEEILSHYNSEAKISTLYEPIGFCALDDDSALYPPNTQWLVKTNIAQGITSETLEFLEKKVRKCISKN